MNKFILIKSILLVTYFLLTLNFLFAQCQADWQWAKGIKGDYDDDTHAMASDKWNNIYIGGETYSSKLIIDSLTMPTGNVDYFIKYNSQGKLIWAKKVGGANIKGMVTDKFGNVYIAGLIWGGVGIFDQIQLIKSTNNQFNTFLVKYSPDGKVLWGKKAYIAQNGTILMTQGVAIDTADGNVVISGSFSGDFIKSDNVNIFHNTNTTYSSTEAFFIVYDTTGNTKWGRSIYSKNGLVNGRSIAADNKGNIYMGGYYGTDLQADTFHRVGGSYGSMYLIKFNSQGKVKWIKDSFKGNVIADNLQVDIDRNIIVSGSMWDSYIKIENYIYTGLQGIAGMIMKVDSTGTIKWIKRILGSYPTLEMSDGRQVVYSTANDAAGNIYAVGTYEKDSLIIDNHHFSKTGGSASANEPFYIKLDKDGNFKWFQRVYVTDTSHASATFLNGNDARVVVDRFGQVYVLNSWNYCKIDISTGKEDTFGQGIIVGMHRIVTPGCTYDIFIGKINNELETAIRSSKETCHGAGNATAKLYIIGGTPPYNVQWSNSSNQQELKNLSPGWYKVMVTDANSCTFKDSIEIKEIPQLYISSTSKQDSAGLHKGEATAFVSGGTPPYTYQWNDATAQKTQKATSLVKGSYKVTVTDKNGCITDTTINITDITGIDELMERNILIYPNPVTSGRLNLEIKDVPQSGMSISIYNSVGKQIIYKDIKGRKVYYQDQFDLAAKGLYLVKIEIAGTVFTKDIVVQ